MDIPGVVVQILQNIDLVEHGRRLLFLVSRVVFVLVSWLFHHAGAQVLILAHLAHEPG